MKGNGGEGREREERPVGTTSTCPLMIRDLPLLTFVNRVSVVFDVVYYSYAVVGVMCCIAARCVLGIALRCVCCAACCVALRVVRHDWHTFGVYTPTTFSFPA